MRKPLCGFTNDEETLKAAILTSSGKVFSTTAEIMAFAPVEPLSSLSVIPEATEENRASTIFVARPLLRRFEAKKETAEVAEVSTKNDADSDLRKGDMSDFKGMRLGGQQTYVSCCCTLF